LTIFSLAVFPIINIFSCVYFVKSFLTFKLIKTFLFGSAFVAGIIAQRTLFFYRKLIVKEIYFYKNPESNKSICIKLLNGRTITDELRNIRIFYKDNDYVTPDYVFTSEDVKKISYFVQIKKEEFYIPRRLIKIVNVEEYKNIIESNMDFEKPDKAKEV